MFAIYYQLTKPGIIYGNALTAIGGFLLASNGSVNFWLFVAMLLGISLVIASACVFNNYIDRGIDNKMARTKKRALVRGTISGQRAIIFASLLGFTGVFLLAAYTNLLTISIALAGFLIYVVLYGLTKRRSVYGTEVGSIAGAVPIVVGYCAVTNAFDVGALVLFIILVLWQMPHFYAIAMYRFDDYKAASIPVLPVKKGMRATKTRILLYVTAFILAISSLTALGYTGYIYLLVMLPLSLAWLYLGVKGFKVSDDRAWARQMFLFSLLVITLFSIMISVDAIIPI